MPSPSCSATTISYKRTKIVAIWQQRKRVSGIFSLRMRRNNYVPPFAPATSISYKTDAFPLPSDVYWIYSMFLCYYVAWPCDLDLLTLRVCHVQCSSCLTHILIFIILRLSVTELRVLNIWSHFCYLKRSLRMRRVTWPLTGGKNSPHFWNSNPNLPIHFVMFRSLRRRLSHVIGKE